MKLRQNLRLLCHSRRFKELGVVIIGVGWLALAVVVWALFMTALGCMGRWG